MKKAQVFSKLKTDELDRMLVTELENNARQSIYDLSAKLGKSPSTVHNRMKRLLQGKAISIVGIPDLAAMGYSTVALIAITARPGTADAVADYLESRPGFRYIGVYTGPYDILFSTAFRTPQDMVTFADTVLSKTPNIANIETMIILEEVKHSWKLLSNDSNPNENTPHHLDQVDFDLINKLVLNPCQTLNKLGQGLEISSVSVGKRLQMLIDTGVFRIVSVADPPSFGFNVHAAIFVKLCPGSEIRAAACHLASSEKTRHVVIITGQFDIHVWAVFRDTAEMYSFLRDELGAVPGIMKHETMIQLSTRKSSFEVVTASKGPARASDRH